MPLLEIRTDGPNKYFFLHSFSSFCVCAFSMRRVLYDYIVYIVNSLKVFRIARKQENVLFFVVVARSIWSIIFNNLRKPFWWANHLGAIPQHRSYLNNIVNIGHRTQQQQQQQKDKNHSKRLLFSSHHCLHVIIVCAMCILSWGARKSRKIIWKCAFFFFFFVSKVNKSDDSIIESEKSRVKSTHNYTIRNARPFLW